ncbi:hypothetical protein QUA20_30520 [Microcoleus sp. Pol7_A1]|uniref:hypothetical protein n=1 Tax=Microcoleus sp. Pol7_A1 TaxID=2818893 RepID=UPI002FCF3151
MSILILRAIPYGIATLARVLCFWGIDERAIALQKLLKQAMGEGCRKVRVRRCDRIWRSRKKVIK